MKNREKQKTLDKQGNMTTQGGKHTRKIQITKEFQKKDIFVIKKLTTENFEFVWAKKSRDGDEEKRAKK